MLEKALEENTKAVLALTAALLANGAKPSAAPAQAPKAPPAQPPAAAVALTYDKDVKPAALKLIEIKAKDGKPSGRDKMVELLKKNGVANSSQLKPEALPTFLAEVKAAAKDLGVEIK